jgi:hypothetical protein
MALAKVGAFFFKTATIKAISRGLDRAVEVAISSM